MKPSDHYPTFAAKSSTGASISLGLERSLQAAFYDILGQFNPYPSESQFCALSDSPEDRHDLRLSDLHHSLVLEQFQTFYLLQEPLTQWFYLCEASTEIPLLKTEYWFEAYRAWLGLRQQQAYQHSQDITATHLHDWVSRYQDCEAFGRLLYRRDRQFRGLLEYAVCLSHDTAIRWAPSTVQSLSLGQLVLEPISRRQHRNAKWVELQAPQDIANLLHRAIDLMHRHWSFNLYQFNSEHWARLVTNGQCCTWQTDALQDYSHQEALSLATPKVQEVWTHNIHAEAALHTSVSAAVPEPLTP
ncbi:MAG TPA: hypothetical protein V6D19_13180 [Stenomitos sp.]